MVEEMGGRAKVGMGRIRCPVCGEAANMSFRPFCSERCSFIDLSGWFNESYRIATTESIDDDSRELAEPVDDGKPGTDSIH